jgi:regulation of enolase protein 1 (concanavalin A-like superfamily)
MRLSKKIIAIIAVLSMTLTLMWQPSHLHPLKTAIQDNLVMFQDTEAEPGDRGDLAQTTAPASNSISAAGNFSDDFNGTTLKPQWKWINESGKDWSLTEGRLKLRRYQKHGFYRTPETYPNQSPVPILYLDNASLDDGFVVQTQAGFFNTTPFGQAGIVVFKDLDNYFKFVIEFNIQQQITVVLLKETDGVDSRTDADLTNVLWEKPSVEMRLTYKGGRLMTEIREPGTEKWIPHFDTPCNLPVGKVKVGLFAESDQPEQGSQEYAWIDNFHLSSAESTPSASATSP